MKHTFNKEDLKSGYVVKLENGETRLVTRVGSFTKILINPITGAWNYLSHWDNRLKCCYASKYMGSESSLPCHGDIVEVYGLITASRFYDRAAMADTTQRQMLWKYVEPKKMTWDQIEEALGYPVDLIGCAGYCITL